MDTLKKIWFLSFKEKKEVKDLVINVIIYFAVAIVGGIVIGLLGRIPFVGWLFGIVGYLLELYITAGVVFTFLNYFKVGPFKTEE